MSTLYNDQPIFTQSHDKNEFVSSGTTIPVIKTLRHKFGYPAAGETKLYFGCTKDGIPVIIKQAYAVPAGNRVADNIAAYAMLEQNCGYDLVFFRQLASDFLFGTNSAATPSDHKVAFQTWMLFVEAIALNSEWRFYNFLYCLNSSATEPMSPECNELDYERLKHTALIARSMDNSTTNKKTAIRLASIDFSNPATITLQSSQIQKALACIEECEYRTNGYMYLLFNSQKLEARIIQQLQRSPEVCDAVLGKYISALKNEDYRSIETYRSFLSGTICNSSAVDKANSAVRYFANADISIRLYVELLCLCCMVDSGECHDYLCRALQEIRRNQIHRHALITFLSHNPTYYKMFMNVQVRNYANELEILSGLYECSIYANDAYYLGMMEYKEYKRFCGSDSTECLCDLALFDFDSDTDEGDEKISRFFEHANPRIRKKVKRAMKTQLTISINHKVKEAWRLLTSAIKEKYQTTSRLKKLL